MFDLFDRLLLLKKASIFSMVPTDDLRQVAQALEEEEFFSGDRIFQVNDQGDHLYLIVTGLVGITMDKDMTGNNWVVKFGPGECFGEMNLLDDLPRSAAAYVLEDSAVLSLDKSRLRGLILSYPELSIGILRSLSLRLREANRKAIKIQE